MDLDDHWRRVRREKAKGRRLPPDHARITAFRSEIESRLEDWSLPNPELASKLNALGLKTYEARSWDAAAVRTFKLALQRVETKAETTEEKRVEAIRATALEALQDPTEENAIRLGLLVVEDRNKAIPGLEQAFDLVTRKVSSASRP